MEGQFSSVPTNNPYVPNVRFALLPISALVSNQDYQSRDRQ